MTTGQQGQHQGRARWGRVLPALLAAAALLLGAAALPLQGLLMAVRAQEAVYTVLDDCDDNTHYSSNAVDTVNKQQGAASLRASVSGTATVQNLLSMEAAVDVSSLGSQYLELWLYFDNANNIVMSDSVLGVYQTADTYGEIKFSKLSLSSGWNKVQVKLSALTYQNKSGFNTINRVYFTVKASRTVVMQFDDICLSLTERAEDTAALSEAVAAGEAMAQEDLSGYAAANVTAFEQALATAQKRLADGCTQRDADVAALTLKSAINAFGMEGMDEDTVALTAYIDFSTNTYSRIARYAIRNADGTAGGVTSEEVGGKTAAAFSGELLLAVDEQYLTAADSQVRITYTYYDGEAGTLSLGYNSAVNAAQDGGSTALNGTGYWVRHTVKVSDAQFSEGIDGRYDLKIALSGAPLAYIARVEVKLVTEDDVTEAEPPAFAPMTDSNDFSDKSVAGYQMWFTAADSYGGSWVHWAGGNVPSNDRISFEMWPDISEYPDSVLGDTAFNHLGDGRPAQLFTSVREETVDIQVSWMQEAGLDGFAIQRFYGSYLGEHAADNLIMAAAAAEKYGRVFYVMYDLNGAYGAGMQAAEVLKSDFVRNVERTGVIQSTSYAQMDGKPVVCMWGLDPSSDSYANHDASMEFICWLQDRGYYVIGGTSNNTWYDGENAFTDVYRQLDMISPWTVGRYSYGSVAKWMQTNVTPALEVCEEYGLEYQPVVLAGSGWHNHNWGLPNDQPRYAGNFLWRQVSLLKTQYGCSRVYFAMYDEYDEATAIMKAAQDSYDIPQDEQYFETLSVDGTWLSSDFYLRLAGRVCAVMRDEAEWTENHGVVNSQGPVYWRNSFEKRWTLVREEDKDSASGRRTVGVTLAPIDVCLPLFVWENDGGGVDILLKQYECDTTVDYVEGDVSYKAYGTNTTGSGLHCDPTGTRTTNGSWSLQFSGTSQGGSIAWAQCRIADTDITVSAAGLQLSYDMLAANDLGRSAYMDLVLEVNGTKCLLSDYVGEIKAAASRTGSWTTRTVTLPSTLVGQKITGVLVAYANTAASATGAFDAYFDNVVLKSPGDEKAMLQTAVVTAGSIEAESPALDAALADGRAVLADAASTDKQLLAAMKAIDSVIRAESLAALSAPLGDVNGDGRIDTTDARLTLQYAAKRIKEDKLDLTAADVNGDGHVDTTDARLILQYAAKRIKDFPISK